MLAHVELVCVPVHSCALRSNVVDRAVASHRQEPRSQRSPAGFESVRLIPHPQKCLLHQVLRRSRIVHDGYDDGPCEPAEAIIEIRHGSRVPSLKPPREFLRRVCPLISSASSNPGIVMRRVFDEHSATLHAVVFRA